jgi:hypothetical protein
MRKSELSGSRIFLEMLVNFQKIPASEEAGYTTGHCIVGRNVCLDAVARVFRPGAFVR